jgi:competence protein ComEC
MALLRALQLSRAWSGLILLPLIWSYVGLTGWPASAVRAAIMMSVVIVGWAIERPAQLINSVFAAGWIILIWNPQQLFEPGFQLSFLVVLCIILLLPAIRKLFEPGPSLRLAPPPPKRKWRLWLEAAWRFALDAFSVSLAAWLGSIPLAACYFHVLTPISVPANFLVVPITALALMSGMASLLARPCLPSLAVLFNHSSWFWMKCIIALSQWFSHWPAAHWNVAVPRPLAFVAYYLALLALCTGWLFQSRHKGALAAAIGLASALCLWDWRGQRQITRMDVLSLRGAPAIYLELVPNGLFEGDFRPGAPYGPLARSEVSRICRL